MKKRNEWVRKVLSGVKTMHAIEEQFNEKNCIETIRILSGDKNLSEMPHSDTLIYYLERLSQTVTQENGTKVKTYYHKVLKQN